MKKIIVMNDLLQDAVDYFVDTINVNWEIDLANKILDSEEWEKIEETSFESILNYEIYNNKLFELFWPLYAEGYNPLEKVKEIDDTRPAIVLESLREFVIDSVFEYQKELKISSEKLKR